MKRSSWFQNFEIQIPNAMMNDLFFFHRRCLFVNTPVPSSKDKERPVRARKRCAFERTEKTLPLSITNTHCNGETYNIITQ